MIDFVLLVIVAGVAWCVAAEGPWGAATTFFAVVLSGLLAMNWFEPFAVRLEPLLGGSSEGQNRADIVALLGLFTGLVFAFRLAGERLMPTQIEVQSLVYNAVRWGLAVATGYVTMAILLTALHTAPLPREFLGFTPERNNFFDSAAPDRQWLAFTQHASERIFTTGAVFDGMVFERYRGRPAEMWSSFPIRYAERRQRYGMGGGGSAAPGAPAGGAPVAPPPPTVAPRGGGQPQF